MQKDLNNITVYNVEYEVKTPLDIDKEYLLGSSIRGAILTRLAGILQFDVNRESINPSLIFHPAFPLEQDIGVFKPAHPFIYKCKICKSILDHTPRLYNEVNNVEDLKELIAPRKCDNNHPFSFKSLGGKLVNNNNKEYKERRIALHSVGINKILGSSEINMIYSSDYIMPGTRFKGYIVQINNDSTLILDEMISNIDNTIFIGRGGSRGFGHVKINIRREDSYITKRREEIKERLKTHHRLILRALSPVFNVDMSEKGLITNYNIRIDNGNVKYIIATKHTRISGFSLLSNIQKISLSGLGEGSLIWLAVDKDKSDVENIVDAIVRIELLGIGMFSAGGLNIVEVL